MKARTVSTIVLVLLGALACISDAFAAIAYVQSNSAVPQTPQTSVSITYTAAQKASDLNVVLIGWWDTTSHVLSVTDTRGNSYAAALAPATQSVAGTHVIYYAPNVAASSAGTNTVTVTFDAALQYPDIRIAEYSGVATTSPVDVAVGAGGSSTTASSGAVTTTNANDLLVAGNYVSSHTTGGGANFTTRLISNPDGSILEDRVVSATGNYSATASLPSAAWVMQMVAFKAAAAGGGDTTAPTAPTNLTATAVSSSQINLAWTASTDNVGVSNYLIERCAGAGCSSFAQVATATTTSYSNTGLAASTSYTYRVRATDAASNLSAYSSIATATTPANADTQAPTAPTNLAATAISTTQINLTWTASTDNVGVTNYLIERCIGAGCTSFTQVATSTSTSYTNTGLTSGTTFVYRVRATDAANNLSTYSATASAATQSPDTTAPTAPSGLVATVMSSAQINLTWTASTDNVGVTNYLIERCAVAGCSTFTQIATSATTNYSNTGLAAATSYSYRVRATDAANNLSAYSAIAMGVTQAGGATATPTYIQSNSAVPQTPQTTVSVTYTATQTASNLNVILIAWYDTTSHVTSVTDTRGNSYGVGAAPVTQAVAGTHVIYYAPNIGASSAGTNTVTVTFDAAVQYPDVRIAEYSGVATISPLDVAVSGSGDSATSSSGAVTTTNATDLLVAGNYVSSRTSGPGSGFLSRVITSPDGSILEDRTTTTTGSYSATALLSSAPWVMQMVAFRAASTGGAGDTTPPTAPGSLAATAASGSQINLTWTASTDNVGVTNYLIESCAGAGCSSFAQIATATGTSYSNTALSASTSYSYRVRATDAANNLSAYSATASATTSAVVDTQAPTAPTSLAAAVIASTQINLTWTASTDNVGVTGYRVERCQGAGCSTFAQIGTTTGTTYGDSSLTASTAYSYRVRATDAASNLSAYSGIASATTQAAQSLPPLAFVQTANAVPQTPQTSVSAAFTGAQAVGNLNVVIVGWYDTTSQISSVTDTAGNTYTLAVGPTTESTAGTQAIYYAANIKAAAAGNGITVTFNAAVPYPDLRIAEYAGVDPNNPMDIGSEATGTSQIPNSGAFVTSHTYDLIVAGNYVTSKTTSSGSGFTNRAITTPDGSIIEDRIVTVAGSYSAQANMDPGSWIMQAVAFRGGTAPGADTVPPTVSVTAPTPNATLSGSTTFTATAADTGGSGLGGVQFQVDGINVGPADTTSPFSTPFNTAQLANGTHTITAYTWDGAHNVTASSSVTVMFSNANAGNPAAAGLWSGPFPWPLVSIHLNLLSDGRLIAWDQFATGNPVPQLWDPITSQFTPAQTNDSDNLFCAGHNTMPDGRLLVAGGEVFSGTGITNSHIGLTSAHIFNPVTNSWSSAASMAYGRWYPNQTTMADGKIFTIAGENGCFGCDATVPEIYDPNANTWTQISQASVDIPWYPYGYLLPDGRLIVTGTAQSPTVTRAYDPSTKSWTTIDSQNLDGGSSAMYLPGKIIKSGTSASTEDPATASAATTYMLDMTGSNPSWQTITPMAFPRTFHVMTTLPDGTVLVTGGGRTTGFADIANAVYQAEIWSPTTQTWSTMASMSVPRLYHQTAILLPDARVLVSGSGRGFGRADPTDQLSGEIYAPPYLFKGARPVITSTPSLLTTGQNFTVQTPDAASVAKVVLIRIGSVTHTFNMDQHYVPLTFTAGGGSLSVIAPANSNLAPPGYYMLFLVNTAGVPSVAKIVRF